MGGCNFYTSTQAPTHPEAWHGGGATSALPFIASSQGKRGEVFARPNWHYMYNTNTKNQM